MNTWTTELSTDSTRLVKTTLLVPGVRLTGRTFGLLMQDTKNKNGAKLSRVVEWEKPEMFFCLVCVTALAPEQHELCPYCMGKSVSSPSSQQPTNLPQSLIMSALHDALLRVCSHCLKYSHIMFTGLHKAH